MKRIFIPVFALSILLLSCNNEKSDEELYHESMEKEALEKAEQSEQSEPKEKEPVKAGNSYDEMLDNYEKFVDSYIVVMKKMKNNDMSVMDEYTDLMEKAENLGGELDKDQGDMSKEQLKRYLDLQNKFTKAIADM